MDLIDRKSYHGSLLTVSMYLRKLSVYLIHTLFKFIIIMNMNIGYLFIWWYVSRSMISMWRFFNNYFRRIWWYLSHIRWEGFYIWRNFSHIGWYWPNIGCLCIHINELSRRRRFLYNFRLGLYIVLVNNRWVLLSMMLFKLWIVFFNNR